MSKNEMTWELVETGWWRLMLSPGNAVVVFDDVRNVRFYGKPVVTSVFVNGDRVSEIACLTLDEAKKWGEKKFFEAFTGASK